MPDCANSKRSSISPSQLGRSSSPTMQAFLTPPLLPTPPRTRKLQTRCTVFATAQGGRTRVGILGASGYTGAELLRLLSHHPKTDITVLTAKSAAGNPIGSVYPQFSFTTFGQSLPPLVQYDAVDWAKETDVIFCCLPHAMTQKIVSQLPLDSVKVVDLSADFRLKDVATYEKWYGGQHAAKDLQKEAVYGITELFRDDIRDARLVANPGCYPTTAQLPLIPLLKENIISSDDIIIDAKSGTSGAGRSPKVGTLFCEVADGVAAYGVASHRHMPEIEQGLSEACGEEVHITFTPHLLPMSRGILETIYVKFAPGKTANDARECLKELYKDEPFVHVLDDGVPPPQTRHVRGTNHCVISVLDDAIPGKGIIVSTLDNVVKGASGQAIQNMNVMMGFPETLGLESQATFP